MDKRDPELQITIKKIVTLSLMEIFKDVLPTYQIKHPDVSSKKCKWQHRTYDVDYFSFWSWYNFFFFFF